MTENFDLAIRGLETELTASIAIMEEIRVQFIQATAAFASKWFNETTKEFVTSNTENTIRLGKEKIKEIKAKVKALTSQASQISSEILSNEELWWHLSLKEMSAHSPYCCSNNNVPEIVNKGVRRIVGRLGPILHEYGFIKNEAIWIENGSTFNGLNVIPYYPYGFDWSQEMRTVMKQYNETYKHAYTKYKEIMNLKMQKQSKQAMEIWNSC